MRLVTKPKSRVLRTSTICAIFALTLLPGGQRSASAQTPPAHRTANDAFAEIGSIAPDFGGMFVDGEKDTLYVYLGPGGRSTAAELDSAITSVLGAARPRYSRSEILEGRYTFAQLKAWHDLMSPLVLAIRGAVSTDINHAANRIRFGVEGLAIEPDIAALVATLGISREAVLIEQVLPVTNEDVTVVGSPVEGGSPELIHSNLADPPPYTCVPAPCTLQKRIRPLLGGIQIGNDTGGICTYSFNAEMGLLRPSGPVTNSHCTNVNGGVEGTIFYQPNNTAATSQIAIETIDPCFWDPTRFPPAATATGGTPCMSPPHNPPFPLWCPPGSRCRLSDSAFGGFQTVTGGDVTFNTGFIAKPTTLNPNNCLTPPAAACTLNWDATTTFRIVAEGLVIQGQTVNKVGRTTGWTRGAISIVCGNIVAGVNEVQICQNRAGYLSAGGDSGSPIFAITNTPNANDVTLVGIHWGAGGIFSPIGSSNDPTVSGVQNAAHELGPFTKCAPGFAPPFKPGC